MLQSSIKCFVHRGLVWSLQTILVRSRSPLGVRCLASKVHSSLLKEALTHGNGIKLGTRTPFRNRLELKEAKRVIVKIGSAVITHSNGKLSAPRLASIVEQIVEMQHQGREMLLVSSGAVAFGRKKIRDEIQKSRSMREIAADLNLPHRKASEENRAAAAVGQSSLMSFYESLFQQYDCKVAQVLVTDANFRNELSRRQLRRIFNDLLSYKIIPIVNTNDAVEATLADLVPNGHVDVKPADMRDIIIADNDSLASNLAVELESDLMIILSNVDGIYSGPPDSKESKFFSTFSAKEVLHNNVKFGSKSNVGLGGMESKIKSALWALKRGTSVVICNGKKDESILKIVEGERIGTFIAEVDENANQIEPAARANNGSKALVNLGVQERSQLIDNIADAIQENKDKIFTENKRDLEKSAANGLEDVLMARLRLTEGKINSVTSGLKQIAQKTLTDVEKVLQVTRVSETLMLKKVTCPIGVLLVIFESRPDCLPQISALSIATGNGLLLKGGTEAKHSNECLHQIIQGVLSKFGCQDAVQLIDSREGVSELLRQGTKIDMIIPRGSNQLVRTIQSMAKSVPVLAHADGICHVYIDSEADFDDAIKIVIDSKCDYPAACNAMETLLVHRSLIETKFFKQLCAELTKRNVKINAGERIARELPVYTSSVSNYRIEYGSLELTLETVDSLEQAIEHINTFGSGHTDVIVTKNREKASEFQRQVDSASTFINCSSRFADGYRFGLGAEVGISTSKLHARGPAGMQSLLSYKWILEGSGDTVDEYEHAKVKRYLHEPVLD